MSSFVFTTRADLDNAINAWISDQASAISTYGDINSWNVSNIQNFKGLFKNKLSFNSNIGNWDVSNGTDFSDMFYGSSSFNQDIGDWKVSSGNVFNDMFRDASSFNQDIGSWDVSNGTDFSDMFYGSIVFDQNISNWDVSSGKNFENMFFKAVSFNQNIGNWNMSSATNLSDMFQQASSFNQDIGGWDLSSGVLFNGMFYQASSFNQNISNWDVSSGINFANMFFGASSFNQDIGDWNVSSGTNLSDMFQQASSFNQDIGNWDVSSNALFYGMFYQASAFNQDISNWDVATGVDFRNMFFQAVSLNQDLSSWTIKDSAQINLMFKGSTQMISNQGVSDTPNEYFIPLPLTIIEQKGSISLLKDQSNNTYIKYSNKYSRIKDVAGTHVGNSTYSGWKIISAETVNSVNKIIWKHSNGDYYYWNLNSNWNQIAGGSLTDSEIFDLEISFSQDFDGDNSLGTTIETNGSISVAKDSSEKAYVIVSGSSFSINDVVGTHVGNSTYSGWKIISAETVNSVNKIIWKHSNGDYYYWNLNSNWNQIAGGSLTDAEIFDLEISFSHDFDGDNLLGIESNGSISVGQDSSEKAYVIVSGSSVSINDTGGTHVGNSTYSGWKIFGAETVNGVNKIIWKHSNGDYYYWNLNSNWNQIAGGSLIDAEIFDLENSFSHDFDGDNLLGIESNGSISIAKDSSEKAYVIVSGSSVSINDANGTHVGNSTYSGWKIISAETVNGVNKIIWKHSNGDYYYWNLNSNWNEIAGGSLTEAEIFDLENSFSQDFDGDNLLGIESNGSISIAKDSSEKAYVIVSGSSVSINNVNGTHVGNSTYSGWKIISAETVNSVNKIIWKHSNGDYYYWNLNSNWNEIAGGSLTDAEIFDLEISFSHDFDGDNLLGIESNGSISVGQDSSEKAYVIVSGSSVSINDTGGTHVGNSTYSGWKIFGAETVNGVNKIIWKHSNGDYYYWNLNSNWNQIAGGSLIDSEIFDLENSFSHDFDGDNLLGIESNGSISIAKDSSEKAYVIVSGSSFSINDAVGTHVGNSTYSGWKIISAETVNSVNKIIWKHSNGDYYYWNLNSNWNQIAGGSLTDAEIFDLEISFSHDFDGDNLLGIESNGSISVGQDSSEKAYVIVSGSSVSINDANGTHVGNSTYSGWKIISAETVNGVNKIIWKHSNGDYYYWNLNSNWNQIAGGSLIDSEIFDLENSFSHDFDGDNLLGIESNGSISVGQDSSEKAYVIVSGSSVSINDANGTHVGNSTYSGWEIISAETVNSVNKIIWKHSNGDYYYWNLNSNWNQIAGGSLTEAEIFDLENSFSQDFDGDNLLGIESNGSISAGQDSSEKAYVIVSGSSVSINDANGTHVGNSTYSGWKIFGAETVNGVNKIIWKHSNGDYYYWNLNSNWNQIAGGSLTDSEIFDLENSFSQDFDGDNLLGIESNGSISIAKDSSEKAYVIVSGSSVSINDAAGTHVGNSTYSGWEIISAETVNGVNKIIWKHSNGDYYYWNLNSNWNQIAGGSLTDSGIFDLEDSFSHDFDGNGEILKKYEYGKVITEKGVSNLSNDALAFFQDYRNWINTKFGKVNGQNYISFDEDSLFKSNKLFETYGILTKSTNYNKPISEFESKDINFAEDYISVSDIGTLEEGDWVRIEHQRGNIGVERYQRIYIKEINHDSSSGTYKIKFSETYKGNSFIDLLDNGSTENEFSIEYVPHFYAIKFKYDESKKEWNIGNYIKSSDNFNINDLKSNPYLNSPSDYGWRGSNIWRDTGNIITTENGTFSYSSIGGGYINIFDEVKELNSSDLAIALSNLSLALTYPIDSSTNINISELRKTHNYGLVAVLDDHYTKKYHVVKNADKNNAAVLFTIDKNKFDYINQFTETIDGKIYFIGIDYRNHDDDDGFKNYQTYFYLNVFEDGKGITETFLDSNNQTNYNDLVSGPSGYSLVALENGDVWMDRYTHIGDNEDRQTEYYLLDGNNIDLNKPKSVIYDSDRFWKILNENYGKYTGIYFDDGGDRFGFDIINTPNKDLYDAFVDESKRFGENIEPYLIQTPWKVKENTTKVNTFSSPFEVTWSISGGDDASKFTIDTSTGTLSFINAPDYENPLDFNQDNSYEVEIIAVDASGYVKTLQPVEVTEVFEENSLNLTSSINYSEHDLLTDWSKGFVAYADAIDAGTYNENIYYYIHDEVTNLSKSNDYGFSLSGFSDKNIYSWTHWDDDEQYIKNIFSDLDKIIDLDFDRTYVREDADIQIYKISETANLDGTMGMASLIPSKNPDLADVEIIWKYFDDSISDNKLVTDHKNGISMYEQNSYTIIHEIGHALGLGHPGGDGNSSFTDANETVMSYNYKQTNKPWTFSYADLQTLKLIWGEENDSSSTSRKENNDSNYTGRAVSINEIDNKNSSSELIDLFNMRLNRENPQDGFIDKVTGDFVHYGSNDFERLSNEYKQSDSLEFLLEQNSFSKSNNSDIEDQKLISIANQEDEIYKKFFSVSGYQDGIHDFDFKDHSDKYFGIQEFNQFEIM